MDSAAVDIQLGARFAESPAVESMLVAAYVALVAAAVVLAAAVVYSLNDEKCLSQAVSFHS